MLTNNNIVDRKGQLVLKNGGSTFYIFSEELEDMEKLLRAKSR